MKACVIFDTRYGNTEKIAKSFEAGLHQAGIETACVSARDVTGDDLAQYDLICVGAPTEWHTASKPMKALLRNLEGIDLSGKYGFAFDTRFAAPLSGSAAKLIEKELKDRGILIIASRESAIVAGAKGGAMLLKEGEEERFKQIGPRSQGKRGPGMSADPGQSGTDESKVADVTNFRPSRVKGVRGVGFAH